MKHKRLTIAMLVLTGLTAASCAGSRAVRLTGSEDIPAAAATVKIGTNDNGNTTFDLVVEHLAPANRVDPAATVYVVWTRGRDSYAAAQNMGALIVDEDLDGKFAGVTPLREFELFITVEPTLSNTTPTGKVLLHTAVATK